MTKLFTLISALFVIACGSVRSQETKLDSVFNHHFSVLDSVANGTKLQNKLNSSQTAFLYIVNGWIDTTMTFDHYRGFDFDTKKVKMWRESYSRYSNKIEPNDFNKAMELYNKFFAEGSLPETDLEYLRSLDSKYRSILYKR